MYSSTVCRHVGWSGVGIQYFAPTGWLRQILLLLLMLEKKLAEVYLFG